MAKIKKLSTPPDGFGDKNKWADYIELLCITSLDKIVSADEIYDKMYGDKSDDESEDAGLIDETEDGDFVFESEELISDEDNEDDITKGEKDDKNKSKINEIFDFLVSRNNLFGEFYPFQISKSPKYIKLKEGLSNKHYSYLGLLASSNLDYLRMHKSSLTTNFETNSLFVFKKLLPNEARIEYFGKGNERGSVFSENKLYDRLLQLSDVLKTPISSLLVKEEINASNTGDGGLDIVGWHDIIDNLSGKVIIFGQCACGLDWYDKQFDIHPAKWDNYISSSHPILRTLITPISFRNYNGDWFKKSKIFDCVIIDRYRFLKSLRKRENSKVALSNANVVEEVIQWNNDYFN